MESAPRRLHRLPPPPSDGRHDQLCPPPSSLPTAPGSSAGSEQGTGTGQYQSNTRQVGSYTVSVFVEDATYTVSVIPKITDDMLIHAVAREHQVTLPGYYHPRVIHGEGDVHNRIHGSQDLPSIAEINTGFMEFGILRISNNPDGTFRGLTDPSCMKLTKRPF
jgi:hypothetical protein